MECHFYLIKTGCQWRMLPNDFPKWQLVYYYYRKWSDLEEFDLLFSKLRERVRINMGHNEHLSASIVDSQSVRCGNNRGQWYRFCRLLLYLQLNLLQ